MNLGLGRSEILQQNTVTVKVWKQSRMQDTFRAILGLGIKLRLGRHYFSIMNSARGVMLPTPTLKPAESTCYSIRSIVQPCS